MITRWGRLLTRYTVDMEPSPSKLIGSQNSKAQLFFLYLNVSVVVSIESSSSCKVLPTTSLSIAFTATSCTVGACMQLPMVFFVATVPCWEVSLFFLFVGSGSVELGCLTHYPAFGGFVDAAGGVRRRRELYRKSSP